MVYVYSQQIIADSSRRLILVLFLGPVNLLLSRRSVKQILDEKCAVSVIY